MRRHLRRSLNPQVIAVAAEALSAWKDEHSHSLFVDALLAGRGGHLGGAALSEGVVRFGRPGKHVYLRAALAWTRSDALRLALSARLGDQVPWRERPGLADRLLPMLDTDGAGPNVDYRRRLAVYGLSRGLPAACETVVRSLDRQRDDRRAWEFVGPRCRRMAADRHGLHGPRAKRSKGFPAPPAATLPLATRDWLESADTRFALWGTAERRDRLSRLIDGAHEKRLGGRRRWSALDAVELGAGVVVRPPGPNQRAKMGLEHVFAPDFDRFEPGAGQPGWLPAGLQITIDDGPRPKTLDRLLDTLARYRVRATFFFVGRVVLRSWLENPKNTRRLLSRVLDEGHTIGFHGMDHLTAPSEHMRMWLPDQVGDAVRLFRRALALAAGRPVPVTYGRTPGGAGSDAPRLRMAFERAGLKAPVYWTVGPYRWQGGARPPALRLVAQQIRDRAAPTTVLLHEYPALARELDVFLSALRDSGSAPRRALSLLP